MNDQYFEKIKVAVQKSIEYEKLEKIADELNKTELENLLQVVNTILLEKTGQTIEKEHIKFYPQYVGNTGIGETLNKKLSNIIFDYYYPKATEKEYAHYTSLTALKSILIETKKIRLTSALKRLKDNEFKLFYADHNLKGYEKEENGFSYDEHLMRDLFYLSFTEVKNEILDDTRFLWDSFGKSGKGVKLVFEIETNHVDFRKVFYQGDETNPESSLLNLLAKEIYDKYDEKVFVYSGVSKMGSFYIDDKFNKEIESRYLVKRFSDDYGDKFNFEIKCDENDFPFIELDFESEWGNFKLTKIQPGKECNKLEVENIVKESGLKIEVLDNARNIEDYY